MTENTFHLGFTMAGAVSAGSYTGGVLDYIFETLHKWELAKEGNLEGIENYELVPKTSNVVIDVMGGTSAGGMTTSMAALYAIKNEINPIADSDAMKVGKFRNNIFYDTWVNLLDDENGTTIEKALNTSDLENDKVLTSLLNSEFIDVLAKKAFQLEGPPDLNPADNLPAYISKDLDVLLSHSMLRGIPLTVNFASNKNASTLADLPSHTSYEHFLMSHFKLNNGHDVNRDQYMWLNPYNRQCSDQLLKATVATGAFPIGLRYRTFENDQFSNDYLKTIVSRLLDGKMGEDEPKRRKDIQWDEELLNDYVSTSVDGGAINNEPYGEVLSILKKKCGSPTFKGKHGNEYQQYGVVMIDPFPDFHIKGEKYKAPEDLLEVVPHLVQTLWNQSKIKRRDMLLQFEDKAYRGQIFPIKHRTVNGQYKGRYDYPIATGMLGGFSGFFDINFRHHDFYLGRNNARNFVRAFLSMPWDKSQTGDKGLHPMHRSWTDAQREKFCITFKKNGEEFHYLPIIPDMNMLTQDIDSKKEAFVYSVPDFPTLSSKQLWDLKPLIKKRIKTIIDLYIFGKGKQEPWCQKMLKFLPRLVANWFKKLGRNIISNRLAVKAVNILVEQIGKGGFIRDYQPDKTQK